MQTDVNSTPAYQLDVEEILNRLQSDWTLLAELCEILIEEMPGMLGRVRDAVEAGDAEAIQRTAHYMKGSVGVFGKGPHIQTVYRLETAGRENRLEDIGPLFREVDESMTRLLIAVEALKENADDRSNS